MKLIGIDYGRRRIGIALTDEEGRNIRGLTTIDCKKHPDPLKVLLTIFQEQKPDLIVLGVPLDTDNNETRMSTEIRAFADRIRQSVPIPIQFIDESLSSRRASELLLFRKKKERRDKANIDRIAACLILEEYRREQGWEL